MPSHLSLRQLVPILVIVLLCEHLFLHLGGDSVVVGVDSEHDVAHREIWAGGKGGVSDSEDQGKEDL